MLSNGAQDFIFTAVSILLAIGCFTLSWAKIK